MGVMDAVMDAHGYVYATLPPAGASAERESGDSQPSHRRSDQPVTALLLSSTISVMTSSRAMDPLSSGVTIKPASRLLCERQKT